MKFILFIILLISCNSYSHGSKQTQFPMDGNYKDSRGRCKFNLGHRMGGDFIGLQDNKLSSAREVQHLESHDCFTCWEFDIGTAENELIVFHDSKIGGVPVRDIHSNLIDAHPFSEFITEIRNMGLVKRICFDIKTIDHTDWSIVIEQARSFSNEVKFLTNKKKKSKYKKQIDKVRNLGFKFGFY